MVNLQEAEAVHGMCMACDSRIQPLDNKGFTAAIWQRILADVPFEDAMDVLERLYQKPQMVVLQPGHLVETWQELQAERERTVETLAGVERYLARFSAEDPPEIVAAKRNQRQRLLESLPERWRNRRQVEAPRAAGNAPVFDVGRRI